MRLSRSQASARDRIERIAAGGLPPVALAGQLMEALSTALPNDGYRLFGVDPETLLINRVLAASMDDGWARREWLQDAYLASAPLSYIEPPALMRLNLQAVAVHERQADSWGFPPAVLEQLDPAVHSKAYHAIRSPVGGSLVGCFAGGGRWIAVAQIFRREPGRPFQQTDVAFLRLVAPVIGRALSAALDRERALSAPAGDAANSGVLVVTPGGRLHLETAAGAAWREFLSDRDAASSGALPAAIWAAIAGARADVARVGMLTARYPETELRVEASPAGTEDGAFAVVITPRQRPSQPEIPAGWGLTAQERRVTILVLRGLSNRQIAATMSVSENTVQTHLRHIYDKLDVRSRTQLAARYFHECFEPGLESSAGLQ